VPQPSRAAGAAWGIQPSDEADARRTLAREFKESVKRSVEQPPYAGRASLISPLHPRTSI
jgi:hypothetical protein